MSIRDKITQKLHISGQYWTESSTSCSTATSALTSGTAGFKSLINKFNFGGVSLFGTNINSVTGGVNLIHDIQEANKVNNIVPLFVSVSEEGGEYLNLKQVTMLPGNMATAASYNTGNALSAGGIIGDEIGSLGFNLDNAPFANLEYDATDLSYIMRGFSDNPNLVASNAVKYFEGLKSMKIVSNAKYFPSYGYSVDPATGFRIDTKSKTEFEQSDKIPFQALIDNGIDMITVSHMLYPGLDSSTVPSVSGGSVTIPASMSKTIVTDILRTQMGFSGVVISDYNTLPELNAQIPKADQVLGMFKAGVDIANVPENVRCFNDASLYETLISNIESAVSDGSYPIESLNESVARILTVKKKYDLLVYQNDINELVTNAASTVGSAENKAKALEIAENAVTIVKNSPRLNKVLPWVPYDNDSLMVLCGTAQEETEIRQFFAEQNFNYLYIRVQRYLQGITSSSLDVYSANYTKVIITTYLENKYPTLDSNNAIIDNALPGAEPAFSVPQHMFDMAQFRLRPIVQVSLGSPQDTSFYNNVPVAISSYGHRSPDATGATGMPNLRAALNAIFGISPITGKLPVDVYDITRTNIVFPAGYSA
ncbi:hypothetical protein BB559_004733 [Furculomyces boomerangus]|nr:hypothetical protein BB559_004733 [Furculomyces boomerangus]PWA02319.1 hypothetical protein BB558_001546 [Smittium angustum]